MDTTKVHTSNNRTSLRCLTLDQASAIATACPGKEEERPAQNFIHAEMMEINKHIN
jgi:hypothetical protein